MSISILAAPQLPSLLGQMIHAATHPVADPMVSPATQPARSFGAFEGVIFLWTVGAVVALFRFHVFSPTSVVGPKRLGDRQQIGTLVVSFATGLLTWLMLQVAYESYLLGQLKHAGVVDAQKHLQEHLRPGDLAILGTVPPIAGLAAMIVILRSFAPGLLDQLGLGLRHLGKGIAVGAVGFLVIFPIILWAGAGLELLYQHFGYEHPNEHEVLKDLGQTTQKSVAALLIVGATICAPLFEELLFRGHVQTLLRRFFMRCSDRWSSSPSQSSDGKPWQSWTAIVLTATLFGLVHPPWMAPLIFVLALGLGYVYERTGILWASITVHLLFNSTETLQFYFLFMRGH